VATKEQRQRIAEQAKYRCGYCQMQEVISGIPLTLEHLRPKARGGSDEDENIWLSCRLCNEKKGALFEAADPLDGTVVPLFNPRTQAWHEHFRWSDDFTQVLATSAVGRATIELLGLNAQLRVRSRAAWVRAGYHPPKDD